MTSTLNPAQVDAPAAPRHWLERLPQPLFGLYAGGAAFGAYFAMYAFRKPFAVAAFSGLSIFGINYKIALVIAQIVGYALSKAIGVKVVSELPANRRIAGILLQVAIAEAALVLFALIPPPWNIVCLLADGLALGMVWGMVFGFVEGRRQSELIGAMLCASFVLASGVTKAVGEAVLLRGLANEFWMPALTGLIFTPLLLVSVAALSTLPPPSAADIAARVERAPMDAAARRRLLRRFAPGLAALVAIYVMLTALRDFRDNFAAEIWGELGQGGNAAIFAWTELPVSALVLVSLASLALVKCNRDALAANLALIALGLVICGAASLLFAIAAIGPVAWMIAIGGGLYLAYTPFNGMLFDRLVAAGGEIGTAGFLIYVADSSGYAGSVALSLVKNFAGLKLAFASFQLGACLVISALGLILLGWSAHYFSRLDLPNR